MTAVLWAFALMGVIVSPAAHAAEVQPAADLAESVNSTAGEISIRDIIASVSSRTRKRFLVDPRVRASVTLVGLGARDVTYPLLLTILDVHGFSAHERDGIIVVVPDAYDRHTASSLVSTGDIRGPDAAIITTIVPVKNVRAVQLVPILRPLMPQQAHLVAVVDRNALLIVDRAANVRRLVGIVEALDKLPVNANLPLTPERKQSE